MQNCNTKTEIIQGLVTQQQRHTGNETQCDNNHHECLEINHRHSNNLPSPKMTKKRCNKTTNIQKTATQRQKLSTDL